MARRNVEVIQCDNCGVKIEHDDGGPDVPPNWRRIVMTNYTYDGLKTYEEAVDVHSPGCGERAAIKAIRRFYGIPDAAQGGIVDLDPVPPADEATV